MNKITFLNVLNNVYVRSIIFKIVLENRPLAFHKVDEYYKWSELIDSPLAMAGNGYLELLKQYLNRYYPNIDSFGEICRNSTIVSERIVCLLVNAIIGGHLHIVKYIIEGPLDIPLTIIFRGSRLLCAAIKYHRDDILDYLMSFDTKVSVSYDLPFIDSPYSGNIEYVKKLSVKVETFYPEVLNNAASVGSIEMIDYLLKHMEESNFKLQKHNMFDKAVADGHLHVLKHLKDVLKLPYDDTSSLLHISLMDRAVLCNRLDILKYLHESNEPEYLWNNDAVISLLDLASDCDLELIQWLHANRSEICTDYLMDSMAKRGSLEILKWLHENMTQGCTSRAMDSAVEMGHMHIVKWLHKNRTEGCTKTAMNYAKSVEMVKWLHENTTEGCTFVAMDTAAIIGNLELVKWYHENRTEGCSKNAIMYAGNRGHIDVFQWLYNNHSKSREYIDVNMYKRLINHHQFELFKWLYNQKDPSDDRDTLPLSILDSLVKMEYSQINVNMFKYTIQLYNTDELNQFRSKLSDIKHIYLYYWNILDEHIKLR